MLRTSPAALPALTGVALLLAVAPAARAANPGSARTTAGQTLSIRIDSPRDGASVPLADLPVAGVAGIGTLGGAATNVVYVLDNSGSTGSSAGDCNGDGAANAGDDVNGDGSAGNVLDCEISGVLALNASLASSGVGAGLVAFGSAADGADMGPAAGQQDFTTTGADANGNGRSDVEDVARSVSSSGVGLFTQYSSSGGGTDFDDAIAKVNAAFAGRAGQTNIAAFLSDGESGISTAAGSALDQARAAGTRINSYSVGTSAAGCGAGSSLRTIADTTGGVCTEVSDPTKLSGAIAGTAAGLQGVQVKVGGRSVAAAVTGIGTWTATVPKAALRVGSNTVNATVTASDGTTATASVRVTVGSTSTAISLPSSKKCISRRLFPIKIRQLRGVRYDFASVFVNGKKVRVYVRRQKRWIRTGRPRGKILNVKVFRAYVDLRGLGKGRYTVRIVVVATTGRVITGTRKYRTCARKLKGGVPKL